MRWNWKQWRRQAVRPRVARAVEAARLAHAGVARGMRSPSAGLQALIPTRGDEAVSDAGANLGAGMAAGMAAGLGSSAATAVPPRVLRAAMQAAHRNGLRLEDVLTEALSDWLGAQLEPPARPAWLEAGRQRTWGEIDETLRALRAS